MKKDFTKELMLCMESQYPNLIKEYNNLLHGKYTGYMYGMRVYDSMMETMPVLITLVIELRMREKNENNNKNK